MRLLNSKEENRRLFDRTENEAQLGKTYCLENDNGQKITIFFFFLVTSARTMHRGVKCQHFSFVFTYCQRLSLQLHLEKTRRSLVTGSRKLLALIPAEDQTDTRRWAEQQLISGGLAHRHISLLQHLKSCFCQTTEVTRQCWLGSWHLQLFNLGKKSQRGPC